MKAKIQHEIQEYCSLLRLNAISEHFEEAIASATDYEGFLHQLLRMEVDAEEARAKERKIKADLTSVLMPDTEYSVSDIWAEKSVGKVKNTLSAVVAPHGARLFKITF